MTLVKLCGITNLEDAVEAVKAGADALGFNFYGKSPRYVSPEVAHQIIEQLPGEVLKIGVFANVESPAQVADIARVAGVSALQLHGHESAEYCKALSEWSVIKALHVSADFDVQQVTTYEVEAIMLDAGHRKLLGGTGQLFDWSIADQVRRLVPKLFLAGGLTAENVAEAIRFVNPYAVDACSSIEDEPGKKNHERMRAFVKAVRSVKP